MDANRPARTTTGEEHLLERLGGGYIMRVQLTSALLATIIGSLIGVVYVYLAADLTGSQFALLIGCLLAFVILVNLIFPVYVRRVTRHARRRLDYLYKNVAADEVLDEVQAWNEIIAFPGQASLVQFISVYAVVIFPTTLLMHWLAGADWFQTIHILVGGSIAEATVVIQTLFLLDRQLAPARQALLPSNPDDQAIRFSLGHTWRQIFVTSLLLLATILMISLPGFQKLLQFAQAGLDTSAVTRQYLNQTIIMSVIVLGVGIIITYLLSQESIGPIVEILRIMEKVRMNDYSERAIAQTSDESALLTIRFNQILNLLQRSQQSTEHQVRERTEALEKRSLELQAASRIVREAATIQDLNLLLARTVDLISDRFGYYHVGIFLLDEVNEYAVLQAASSEGGKRMLARGHRLEVGHQGIVGAAAYQNRARIAVDVGVDPVFFDNPDLPDTRSEAAFPLNARNRVIGVLDIQSTEPAAFSRENLELLQTMADQVALAIYNARLIAESQNTLRQLEAISIETVRQNWKERVRQQKYAYQYSNGGVLPLHREERADSLVPEGQPASRLNIAINLRGQQIGSLSFVRKGESEWGDAEQSLAGEIASQIGLALENARLLEEAQRHAVQEQSISELTTRLSSSLDPENLMQTTLRELHQIPNVAEVSVYITPAKPAREGQDKPS